MELGEISVQLVDQIAKIDKYIYDLEQENDHLKNGLKQLDSMLETNDHTIRELRAKVEELERTMRNMRPAEEVNSLKAEINELRNTVRKLEGDLHRKDQEIAGLASAKTDLENRLKTSEQNNNNLRQSVSDLTAQLNALRSQLDAELRAKNQ